MNKNSLIFGGLLLTAGLIQASYAVAEDEEHFHIQRFAVEGNTLLSAPQVLALTAPYTGQNRVYGDVQRALEALEGAYRSAGYQTVRINVPEQELTQGVVRFVVTEAVIGKITVGGNQHFSEANVRAALPALQEGQAPNARLLSENIQLANDNPARQLNVTLSVGTDARHIDAKVAVSDEPPQKIIATLDNTGSAATGRLRTGLAWQQAHLLQTDQTLTLAYTTSPDAPEGVRVNVYSATYHLPIYALGDSLDLLYGNSSINAPSVQTTGFGLAGKGSVALLRYNHYFPRQGEFSNKLSLGYEHKYFNTRCSIGGVEQPINPPVAAVPACTPYTTRLLGATYAGQWQTATQSADYQLALATNLPTGSRYLYQGALDRYSQIANRAVPDHFTLLRLGGSYTTTLPAHWQARAALSGQYSPHGLVAGEQFSLAGSNAVRGFGERVVTADQGHLLNLEIYTPELASWLGLPGNLRALAFYDLARGRNIGVQNPATATPATAAHLGIAAGGLGVRYNLRKTFSLRADVANVTKAGPVGTEERGDWSGHASIVLSY
ncbi:MAG: ShlB/FhaC/HecB family hemolysin secretion/activation protein [Sterolibacterium sp.]|jgi:hemolysin activation/secretion protein|nr:ShlB/FhaC/HecB family hemolysin secretion/activation protein [Sterolibacterium sp.]